jgi:hypothetical protein
MRIIVPGLFLVACSCGSSSDTTMFSDAAVACAQTIDEYCAARGCDATLDAAKQDKLLCPSYLATCGSYALVTQRGVDTGRLMYYRNNQLVASFVTGMLPGHGCVAGPAMFDPPVCPAGDPLPVCTP